MNQTNPNDPSFTDASAEPNSFPLPFRFRSLFFAQEAANRKAEFQRFLFLGAFLSFGFLTGFFCGRFTGRSGFDGQATQFSKAPHVTDAPAFSGDAGR